MDLNDIDGAKKKLTIFVCEYFNFYFDLQLHYVLLGKGNKFKRQIFKCLGHHSEEGSVENTSYQSA